MAVTATKRSSLPTVVAIARDAPLAGFQTYRSMLVAAVTSNTTIDVLVKPHQVLVWFWIVTDRSAPISTRPVPVLKYHRSLSPPPPTRLSTAAPLGSTACRRSPVAPVATANELSRLGS
jgi:hypothetical protein